MSPDEVRVQAEHAQAQAMAALAAVGPAALDGWRMAMEVLEGMVQISVAAGWPEPLAREMVGRQFLANLPPG